MSMDLEGAKAFFEKDYFALRCGITIDAVGDGEATCSFGIKEYHLNAGGAVQGGALFTLADLAFAVAANSHGRLTVSLDNQISFMHVSKGKRLIATANEVSTTKTIGFVELNIEDELGN